MIHAYREMYLNNAQSALGDTFDYAINSCSIPGDDFIKMFVGSSVSKRMEKGEPAYVAGKSGMEIAKEILDKTAGIHNTPQQNIHMFRSAEYWIGWAVAYYQWFSQRKYKEIFQVLSFSDLKKMYTTLHEADISKFVEIAEKRIQDAFPETNLKRMRTLCGCTQAELAKQSEVNIRSIQMYEQRRKDINKASVEIVHRLSKVLGCTIDDLMERQSYD